MKLCLTILLILISVLLNKGEVYKATIIQKRASFIIAYTTLRKWEGNWVNDPDDFGLETYGGITRRYNNDWYGWRYVEKHKNKKFNQYIPEAEHWVMDYYLDIWVKEGFYNLSDQEVANYLFDLRIHLYTNAIKLVNNTYNLNVKYQGNWINKDMDTLDLQILKQNRRQFYLNLIKRKPHYQKFKTNWLRRANYEFI